MDIINQVKLQFNPNVEGFTPQAWNQVGRAVEEGLTIPLSYGFNALIISRKTGTGRLIEPTGRVIDFKPKGL